MLMKNSGTYNRCRIHTTIQPCFWSGHCWPTNDAYVHRCTPRGIATSYINALVRELYFHRTPGSLYVSDGELGRTERGEHEGRINVTLYYAGFCASRILISCFDPKATSTTGERENSEERKNIFTN